MGRRAGNFPGICATSIYEGMAAHTASPPPGAHPVTAVRVALTTLGTREAAERLAQQLVTSRLAACVNLIDRVHSVYRWEGAVEEASEVLLLIKTDAGHLPAVEQTVSAFASYDLPEFLVFAPESGSAAYLHWIAASLTR